MNALKHIATAVLMLLTISVTAQQGINYKALIKDNLGNVVANQTIDVRFTIIADTGPTNVYVETHTGVATDANGIVILNIGEGTTSDVFTDIAWGSDTHALKVEIDIEQDASFVDMGTTQFMAVPYALSAANTASKIDELTDGKSDANGSSLFLGIDAGLNDDGTDNNNVGIGYQALTSNTTGEGNTANGYNTLANNTTGSFNTANGAAALFNNTTGFYNIATGVQALNKNTTGSNNTANGFQALFRNTTGNDNTANGYQALSDNIEGNSNTANGSYSLTRNTTGIRNTANGTWALFHNTTGEENTAIGYLSLYWNAEGDRNVANGIEALYSNTEGSENTANGYQALYSNTTGFDNTATGFEALYSNTTGIRNTATGYEALRANLSGNYNTGFGYKTLYNQTSGHWNTAIGRNALLNLTAGTNNIGIGYNAQLSSTTASNEVIIGNSSNNKYRIWTGGWIYASDRKLKHAIQNIPVGLDFVLKLRPVEFIYNNANNEQKTFGFIAQEVKEAVKQSYLEDNILVSPLNKDYLGLRTTELISVLTKAIQEQQAIIDNQGKEIKSLTSELTITKEAQKVFNTRLIKLEETLNISQQ